MVDKFQKQQIRNLLVVLGSGFLAACLLGLFMLYHYGPSGQYLGRDALLSPRMTQDLNYNDYNSKTNGDSRFIYDKSEFAYYDTTTKQLKKITVSEKHYQDFYNLIANDISILNPTDLDVGRFSKGNLATLTLLVKTESPAAWQAQTKTFQEVQIVPEGDYYRIELREQNPSGKWVYFYHPNIYNEAIGTLSQ
jgi:hypothetical protein